MTNERKLTIVSRFLRTFALFAVGASVFIVVGSETLYRELVQDLGPPPAKASHVPKRVRECLWVAQGGHGSMDEPKVQPWTMAGRIVSAWMKPDPAQPVPGRPYLAAQIARQWVRKDPPLRHVTYQYHLWAAEVWVSRHLSTDQQLAYLATETYLGQGVVGFDEGARVFFGKPLTGLSVEETATLCAISSLPADLRPMRSTEMLVQKRLWILQRLHAVGFIQDPQLTALVNTKR